MTRECRVIQLGCCGYQEAFRLQKLLLSRRIARKIPDTLLLLQHPPVYTIGRRGASKNILAGAEVLAREGIQVFETDRGGDITYHGPGQIVGYPILDLNQHGRDVHRVIDLYEEVVINLLKGYGIEGYRLPGHPGVWSGGEKICAIGIGVSNWVAFHGFALNVNINLEHFSFIIPCGIAGRGVTSMEKILGYKVEESAASVELAGIFGRVFKLEMRGGFYMEVKLPFLAEGVDGCTVSFWHVSEGEHVEEGDDLVEMETSKAAFNVPSPCAGTVTEILVGEGDEVKVGYVICIIEESD